jgi:hypothetical protein
MLEDIRIVEAKSESSWNVYLMRKPQHLQLMLFPQTAIISLLIHGLFLFEAFIQRRGVRTATEL